MKIMILSFILFKKNKKNKYRNFIKLLKFILLLRSKKY